MFIIFLSLPPFLFPSLFLPPTPFLSLPLPSNSYKMNKYIVYITNPKESALIHSTPTGQALPRCPMQNLFSGEKQSSKLISAPTDWNEQPFLSAAARRVTGFRQSHSKPACTPLSGSAEHLQAGRDTECPLWGICTRESSLLHANQPVGCAFFAATSTTGRYPEPHGWRRGQECCHLTVSSAWTWEAHGTSDLIYKSSPCFPQQEHICVCV